MPTPTVSRLCAELQAIWRNEIPLTAAMGVEVAECDGETISVRAPLAPNVNVHGTAFAGSLYSICVLTAWGATWLAIRGRDLHGRIVATESRVVYHRAVTAEIVCRSRFDSAAQSTALAQLLETGRATFAVESTVGPSDGAAVTFAGLFAVRLRAAG